MGAGLGREGGFIHWPVVRRMVFAWILTMPAAAVMGAIAEETVAAFPSDTTGSVFVGIVAAVILAFIFMKARRNNVNADNVMDEDVPPTEDSLRPVLASV